MRYPRLAWRCGASAAPNYDEGRVGESRADFIHKVTIALKELVETGGWLKFLVIAELISAKRIQPLLEECDQLIKILAKSQPKAAVTSNPIPASESLVIAFASIDPTSIAPRFSILIFQ
jgi:four helix bundle protein